MEKAATKGYEFFGLFDWGKSKKSKRRLFRGSEGYSPAQGKQTFLGSQSRGCRKSKNNRRVSCRLYNLITSFIAIIKLGSYSRMAIKLAVKLTVLKKIIITLAWCGLR